MSKDKLVAEMLTAKAEKNNTIDLDTYANGLADMYNRLVNLCNLPVVSTRYFLFSGRENGNATKYLVDDCDDRETAIAKIETEYPDFKWVMTEEFNGC